METAVSQNLRVEVIITDDPDECLGAGTRAEMVLVEQAFRRRANNKWLANGVTLVDPATTFFRIKELAEGRDPSLSVVSLPPQRIRAPRMTESWFC